MLLDIGKGLDFRIRIRVRSLVPRIRAFVSAHYYMRLSLGVCKTVILKSMHLVSYLKSGRTGKSHLHVRADRKHICLNCSYIMYP